MLGATPTSNGHRSLLCTMVHNTGWWCTTQVDGAQRSPVPVLLGGAQRRSQKPVSPNTNQNHSSIRIMCPTQVVLNVGKWYFKQAVHEKSC